MTTPWLLTCPPNAALVNLIRGWRNRSTHRFTASFQGFSASCYELKGGFRWGSPFNISQNGVTTSFIACR